MYRLIIKLEWILGVALVALATPTLVLKIRLFDGAVLVVLVLAVALTLLFLVGSFIAPDDKTLTIARPHPYHRELFLLSASFGIFGLLPLLSDFQICDSGKGRFCGALTSLAEPLGFSDLNLAMATVTLLTSLFFAIYGYRFYRSGAGG